MQIAQYTDIGKRPENEDSIAGFYVGNHFMAVVADGLGGHGGGAIASQTVIDTLKTEWNGSMGKETWKKLIEDAHEAILSKQTPQTKMKSTIVGLMLGEGKTAWAHVGDSRLYHFVNGKLAFQTIDHSAAQIALMLGQITKEELRGYDSRNVVVKALGQGEDPVLPTFGEEEQVEGEHAYLLCSDGFWENILEDEMEQEMKAAWSAQEWLERMKKIVLDRAGETQDNHSAIAIWM